MPKQGSKSGKSSKTARVLNLLTDPDAVETPEEPDAAKENAAANLASEQQAEESIRGALESALESELAEAAAAPARPKRPKSGKDAAPAAKAEEPEKQEKAEKPEKPAKPVRPSRAAPAAPAAEPVLENSDAEPSAPGDVIPLPQEPRSPLEQAVNELRTASEEKPDEFICFNVMQALVEDKADKYIRMFGLCSCARCRIDVIALALSNLPAKYVVAKPHELIPRLSIYEQKFSAAVVTQVMSACRKVLERPHHQREQ
ncbi:MAG: hypothetical protein E7425_13180 [Ruminococcaceae bacterium]|jgi:chemotaxis protein histidine kinase CheA|nr:hypothetical protein [Oscillospiraceae bacterium]